MEHFNAGLLKIETRDAPELIEVLWTGRSTERNPAQLLGPYLSSVLVRAESRGAAVAMHFEHLEYFNSATISAILTLLHEARRRNLRLMLSFDDALKWQATNFATIKHLFLGYSGLELQPLSACK